MAHSYSTEMLEEALRERLDTLTGFGSPEAKARKLAEVFKKVDTNGSGCVDGNEFLTAMAELNFLDVPGLMDLFNKYDVDGTNTLDIEEFAEGFTGLRTTAADVDATTRSVLGQLRNAIARRGGLNGIRSLGRLFRIIDDSGNGRLSYDELKFGLLDFGLDFSERKVNMVIEAFDRNHDGVIDYNELLRGLRGKMNKRRRELVLRAFDVIDKDGSGVLTIEDLANAYDTSLHPDVVSGSATADDVLREFLGQWETVKRDGLVDRNEFLDYFKDLSASVDNDDYFELMIKNCYRIFDTGEGVAGNTANMRVLVVFRDGRQEVVPLHNDLGIDRDNITAIKLQLYKQGIEPQSIERIETAY
ncbi:EF hand family protein [Thecamonas trahens ATCC 50062]|uniref:EF hand family protein n=1 Tax=Thecamonas trahens ATCC 50062 TaxID=461836 RepID=A0A0L0DH52_THETB|nr:EF hand family protein [Thecamonas trahens ATCC 50062]KNC50633.1 EF hand family protein [Thecamonas trahens ATCC 50062]|eukprot:XP_013762519.1 EF hand family protein [Thecamonas trahens ATCC 50062]